MDTAPGTAHMEVFYDGQCPFCASWMRLARLRENVGRVELIDARLGDARVAELLAAGYDLDEGIVVRWKQQVHHGAEALNLLARMARPQGLFNRMQQRVFGSLPRSRAVYPWLRRGRKLVLRLLGRTPIAGQAVNRQK